MTCKQRMHDQAMATAPAVVDVPAPPELPDEFANAREYLHAWAKDYARQLMAVDVPADVVALIAELDLLCSCGTHPRFPNAVCLNCRTAAMLHQQATEIAKLKDRVHEAGITFDAYAAKLISKTDAVKAENAELRKDAKRYRFLREAQDGDLYMENTASTLDRAIDAATAQTSESQIPSAPASPSRPDTE